MNLLDESVTTLKGIGFKRATYFETLGIKTIRDLLQHYPFRYEDYTELLPVHIWQNNETVAYFGEVVQTQESRTRRGQIIFKALLSGKQGDIVATWFGRRQLARSLTSGKWVFCVGRSQSIYQRELVVNHHEILSDPKSVSDHLRIKAVYPATERLESRWIAAAVEQALDVTAPLPDILPAEIDRRFSLLSWSKAIQEIHLPSNRSMLFQARKTLAILEFVWLILWARTENVYVPEGIVHIQEDALTSAYLKQLPYVLTNDQRKVIEEIWSDMADVKQMHRLLQGDVGSGKTTIAILALLRTVASGYQGALMVPTEILARQHYNKSVDLLASIGVKVGILTGRSKKNERNLLLTSLADGSLDILIGTHAMLEEVVQFKSLGLVVIDEQHRFGVRQRNILEEKGSHPDVLVMTATPIPRSLALTVYGDLELSLIRELPPDRQKIQTMWIRENKRADMYGFIRKEMDQGHQVYVVCPLLAESEKMDLANATALAEHLSRDVFPMHRIGLLHGQMKNDEKREVMQAFLERDIQLLVSTTVIEVGIDVPNATIMVIENAERFGLAQLHQLRGRVGRGKAKSYCILISETTNDDGIHRLRTMVGQQDGFAIAEADLALRGPGELLGFKQHGTDLFHLADPVKDAELVPQAREIARCIEEMDVIPDMVLDQLQYLKSKISTS